MRPWMPSAVRLSALCDGSTIANLPAAPRGRALSGRTGNIEADWLNGEIVLLGRLHHVATPVNELLRSTATRMAREGIAPGSIEAKDLLDQL